MATAWLRADEVAATRERAEEHKGLPLQATLPWVVAVDALLSRDIPALCAQDARWRALVGALVAAADAMLAHTGADRTDRFGRPLSVIATVYLEEFQAAFVSAQAALDGEP